MIVIMFEPLENQLKLSYIVSYVCETPMSMSIKLSRLLVLHFPYATDLFGVIFNVLHMRKSPHFYAEYVCISTTYAIR